MKWIGRDIQFPKCLRILCYESGDMYISDLLETKSGNIYCSTDWVHCEKGGGDNWTHWMPLPPAPE